MTKRFLNCIKPLARRASGHPDLSALIAYQDGELNSSQARRIRAHLDRCTACLFEVTQVSAELANLLPPQSLSIGARPVDLDAGLDRVRAAMAALSASDAPRSTAGPPGLISVRLSHVTKEMEFYFGPYVIDVLKAEAEAGSLSTVISALQPLLTTFLGRDAARAMIENVALGWQQS